MSQDQSHESELSEGGGSNWMSRTFSAPASRLAMLRILVGTYASIYLAIRLPHIFSFALDDLNRFSPVGLVSLAETPLLPWIFRLIAVGTFLLSLTFVAGFRHRVLAPLFAFALLFTLTHTNSWGMILHTDNLLVLHVIALSFCRSADTLSRDSVGKPTPEASWRYGWPIVTICAVGALVYLLAGIAKYQNSGLEFVSGDTLRNYVAYDNMRKLELGDFYSPLGAALLPYPGVFAALAGFSFILELTGPIALFSKRFGKLWALAVWSFHLGVLALMAIAFIYQMVFVAFASFFDVEHLLRFRRVRWLLRFVIGPHELALDEPAVEQSPDGANDKPSGMAPVRDGHES